MTSARSLKPLSLFQRFSALCANLNTMDNMVARETAFLGEKQEVETLDSEDRMSA
jgi:hypothetical protein